MVGVAYPECDAQSWRHRVRICFFVDAALDLPCRQFGADIIGRADQARFCKRSTKDHELAKADGTSFFCDPTEAPCVSFSMFKGLLRSRGKKSRMTYSSRMETGRHDAFVAARHCMFVYENRGVFVK